MKRELIYSGVAASSFWGGQGYFYLCHTHPITAASRALVLWIKTRLLIPLTSVLHVALCLPQLCVCPWVNPIFCDLLNQSSVFITGVMLNCMLLLVYATALNKFNVNWRTKLCRHFFLLKLFRCAWTLRFQFRPLLNNNWLILGRPHDTLWPLYVPLIQSVTMHIAENAFIFHPL